MKQSAIAVCCVVLLLSALACETRRDRERPRMSQQELQNRSMLEPYPEPVQASFLRDQPTGNVTRVDVYNDVTGRVLYQVNFVRDGRMENVVYTSTGERIMTPPERAPATPGTPAAPGERTAPTAPPPAPGTPGAPPPAPGAPRTPPPAPGTPGAPPPAPDAPRTPPPPR